MMNESIRFIIEEEEWFALPKVKRERIKSLMLSYGYDIGDLEKDDEDNGWN